MAARYHNGEPVTAGRIQDESWYADYQSLMEMAMGETDIDTLVSSFNKDYESVFGREYPDQAQLLRWAVLHTERMRNMEATQ